MPDTKFSWRALREHIRKYFFIYLVGIAVCLLGTNLLWTSTRPQLANDQTVMIYLADGYVDSTALDGIARDMLEKTQADDPALQDVEFQNLQFTGNDYSSSMLLMTRLSVNEGDAFLAGEDAMDALVRSRAALPLDALLDGGWLAEYNLEPYRVTLEDEETGTTETFIAGLRLDSVTALRTLGAMDNEGAFLCLIDGGGNPETTRRALEYMMKDLTEAAND